MSSNKEKRKLEIIKGSLKLFAQNGFYVTTIPIIAKDLGMSVGNMYNYFKSKEELAQEALRFISKYLAKDIRAVNESNLTTEEKIRKIVAEYFKVAQNDPQMIEFFLRVYLSNREVFKSGCEGMICVNEFVTEIMIFFEEGGSQGRSKKPRLL